MSNISLAYKFTGENFKHLKYLMGNIKESLDEKNHKIFCSLFLENEFQNEGLSSDEIYTRCANEQEYYDNIIYVLDSNQRSKGMEIELEKAIEYGQKQFIINRAGVFRPNFYHGVSEVITFQKYDKLFDILKKNNNFKYI